MKIIFLLLWLLVLPIFTYAAVCYNPDSSMPMCEDINLPNAKELCCPSEGYTDRPKSQKECEQYYFDPTGSNMKKNCDTGCCLTNDGECNENIARILCVGIFNPKDCSLLPQCQPKCCCTNDGYLMTTHCDGKVLDAISEDHCSILCSKLECVSGCVGNKYCSNNHLVQDCTGGDGIAGNENDCGCPSGQICTFRGDCIEINPKIFTTEENCVANGFYWCKECQKKPCNVTCGANSYFYNGFCFCEKGYYDDVCSLDSFADQNMDGCVKVNPCVIEKKPKYTWLFGIIILLILLIVIVFRRKPRPAPVVPLYGQSRTQTNAYNYYNNQYNWRK